MLTYRKNIQVILIALAAAWPAFAGDAQDLSKLRQTYEQHRDAARAIETLNVDTAPVAGIQAELQTIRTQLEAAKRDLSDIRTRVERVIRTGGPKAASSLTQAGTPQTYVGQQQPIIDALEQQLQAAEQGLARRRGTLMQIQEAGRMEAERRGEEEIRRRQREQQAAAGDIDTLRALMRSVEDELVRSETELARLRQDTQDRERALNDQIAQLQRTIDSTRAELARIQGDAAVEVKACRDDEKRLQDQLAQLTRDRDAAQAQRDQIQAQRDQRTAEREKAVADYQQTLDLLNQANARAKAAEDKARVDLKACRDEVNALTAQITALRKTIEDREKAIDALERGSAKREADRVTAVNRIAALEAEMRAAQEKAAGDIKACQDDLKRITAERDAANARIVQIGITPEERAKLQGDLKQLQNELLVLQGRLTRQEGEAKEKSERAVAEAKKALDAQLARVQQLTAENQNARQEAGSCKQELEKLNNQIKELQAQLKACEDQLKQAGNDLKQSRGAFDAQSGQMQTLQTQIGQLRDERKGLAEQIQVLQTQINDARNALKAAQAERDKALADLADRPEITARDLEQLRNQLKACRDSLALFGDITPVQIQQLRADLAQAQQGRIKAEDTLKAADADLRQLRIDCAAIQARIADEERKRLDAEARLKDCVTKEQLGQCTKDLEQCRAELAECQQKLKECLEKPPVVCPPSGPSQADLQACRDELEKCQQEVKRLGQLTNIANQIITTPGILVFGPEYYSGASKQLISQYEQLSGGKLPPASEKPAAGTAGQPDPGDAKRATDCESKLAACQAELADVLARLKAANYPSPTIQQKIDTYSGKLPNVKLSPEEQRANIVMNICGIQNDLAEAAAKQASGEKLDLLNSAQKNARALLTALASMDNDIFRRKREEELREILKKLEPEIIEVRTAIRE